VTAARPLLLVGAGGFARETAAAAAFCPEWTVLGLCDDDPARHGTTVDGLPVLGPAEVVHEYPTTAVLLCTGSQTVDESLRLLHDRVSQMALGNA